MTNIPLVETSQSPRRRILAALFPLIALVAGCNDPIAPARGACVADGEPLNVHFYAYFEPVSYSDDPDPAAPAFQLHRGYEADLLSALALMEESGLAFERTPVARWDDIWLLPARSDVDIAGGGITILESRTRNAAGEPVVTFTSGHIAFRQSLLVRAADRERLSSYDRLTRDIRVGALPGTTGEARFLVIAGIASETGILIKGTRIETPTGTLVADGSDAFVITASAPSETLAGRTRLIPPLESMPQVVYLGRERGETELVDALAAGSIDAVARGEIGNQDAALASNGAFAVAALDTLVELGGFVLDREATALRECIDRRIDWLTDARRIGYAEWRRNNTIFAERARMWNPGGG